MNWMWTEFSECVCTVHCSACGWPSPVQVVLVIGSSQHLLPASLTLRSSAGSAAVCCIVQRGGLGIESVGVSGGHKRGKQCAVVCVVTADKLGVSCVLPALTCWVELCTDRTCISPLGTVGSAAHAHYTNLNVSAGHVFTMIIKY